MNLTPWVDHLICPVCSGLGRNLSNFPRIKNFIKIVPKKCIEIFSEHITDLSKFVSVNFSMADSRTIFTVICILPLTIFLSREGLFYFVSLFNGSSTFVGYLMPKPSF